MTTQKYLDFAHLMLHLLHENEIYSGRMEAGTVIRELENDLQYEAAKQNGKCGEKQRTKAAEKFLSENQNRNSTFQYAYTMRNEDLPYSLYDYAGEHGLVNGAAIIVTDHIIGLPEPENEKYHPEIFKSTLPDFSERPYREVENFDPASVAVHIATKKAQADAEYRRYNDAKDCMRFELENGKPYGLDAKRLKTLITMLGGKEIKLFLPAEIPHYPCKLESPRGVAFLLPVRVD